MVSLNTLYWKQQSGSEGGCDDRLSAGSRLLRWLETVLEGAAGQSKSVVLCGHVPPWMYTRACRAGYEKLVHRWTRTIKGQFFGHTHQDEFQVQRSSGGVPYGVVLVCPAVRAQLNPSYREYEYQVVQSEAFELVDYCQYYLDLEGANQTAKKAVFRLEYSVRAAYNFTETAGSLAEWDRLDQRIQTKAEPFHTTYNKYKRVSTRNNNIVRAK